MSTSGIIPTYPHFVQTALTVRLPVYSLAAHFKAGIFFQRETDYLSYSWMVVRNKNTDSSIRLFGFGNS